MDIWALGDIHANLPALDAALAEVDADPAPIVILGDVLTYGPDPLGVLDRLARRTDILSWVLGNHDELYLRLLQNAPPSSYGRLPDWLRDAVDWCHRTVAAHAPAAAWYSSRPFVREYVDSGLLFAHANPYGDWRYVKTDEDHREAAMALARRGISVAVLSHTHRARFFTEPPRTHVPQTELAWGPRHSGVGAEIRILNAGSVGQPRDRNRTATILRLRGSGRTGEARIHALRYDMAPILTRIQRLPLPSSTIARLMSFYGLFAAAV